MWTRLKEKVPRNYRRLYLFFGEDDFRAIVAVNGSRKLFAGCRGKPGNKTLSNVLDWQLEVITEIRGELQAIQEGLREEGR